MPRDRRFVQVDVFTAVPTLGNPLAVVVDGDGLDDREMAGFARWMNLSETAFLLPPTDPAADYRVRIFTPSTELPFAGHPTLGSCRAWLDAGGRPRRADVVVQECGVGLVTIATEGRLAFEAPPVAVSPVEPTMLTAVLAALGLPAERVRATSWLVNGPRWLTILVDAAETVLALDPDHGALRTLAEIGVAGPYAPGSEASFEVRVFADPDGVPEDPVTGSLNAALAQWLIGSGRAPGAYLASQGARVGRAGRVHVSSERDDAGGLRVWIGGDVAPVVSGTVRL